MVIGVAHLGPLLSIVFGILILILPKLLNYLVGIYLILIGPARPGGHPLSPNAPGARATPGRDEHQGVHGAGYYRRRSPRCVTTSRNFATSALICSTSAGRKPPAA